ncbi:hypothetical protein AUJ59_01265 [Candidatus Beckwithbacteria bacterium CG1_02_47_37]|uniref:Uncharacterized protein n=2 Tax=Candidatus Beckwithiibacteriota TaxID=1752726 RepID=A0A1J4RUE0_9BACT|nr:MAG: hypothetical protein AUJ59_01265 [Candidatus Beckwithbacteria bacterium CG1_02_47_37]PIP51993.1 MAG: hypothetical protein COX09_04090 [Candidatus Beckwithbacteria bacterium CG23_combo_of_CG06-09_8_20_14_all_47_9]
MLKFTKTTGYKFDRGDIKGFSFNTKEQFSHMSAAWFECNGKHPKMKSFNSDRLYFILQGKGEFIVNNQSVTVKQKEVIIIPKNTPYNYKGKFTCFLVHCPAFDRKQEIRYNE